MEQDENINEIVENTDKPILWRDTKPKMMKANDATKRIRQAAFLKALAQCGTITHALKAAGVNQTTELKLKSEKNTS